MSQSGMKIGHDEKWFRSLLEKMPTAAHICDPEGRIKYFNQRTVETWGRRPELNSDAERFCGSFRLYHPDGRPMSHDQCWMALALKNGEEYSGREVVIERPDGSRLTALVHISLIRDEAGKLLGAMNVTVDITERKQAEAAMAQLAAIVESSDDAIISKDLNGDITSWNKGAEKLFGYAAEEVIGKSVTILFPQDRLGEERRILERVRHGVRVEHYETVRRRKDGSAIDISLTVSPIRDKAGNIIGASKIARDITARRRRDEEALRESEGRFRLLADSTPVLIWVNGPDGCEFVNREYLEFLGADESEVRGHGWARFVHPEDRDAYVDAYLKAASSRSRFEAEFRFRWRDGEYRWMRSVGKPRFKSGEFVGYAGSSYDITEHRRIEAKTEEMLLKEAAARAEAEAANRRKDEFLAVVSHELRSPLNAILGYNRMLRDRLSGEPQLKQACDIIERSARMQLRLIEDLLDTARIVSGKLNLEMCKIDIVPVIAEAFDVVRPEAEANGVRLRITDCGWPVAEEDNKGGRDSAIHDPQPVFLLGDAARLQQIVWNLLSNAVKSTPAGGQVELRTERADKHIRIIVSDTGKGIRPEFLPYVFDRFWQGDSSVSQRSDGLGLGLALVKHLTELHGGTVEAASEGEGRGATFTVTLPLVAESELVAAEPLAMPWLINHSQ